MATHSSILAWRIPWTEEPGGLQESDTTERVHFTSFLHHLNSCFFAFNLEKEDTTSNSLPLSWLTFFCVGAERACTFLE